MSCSRAIFKLTLADCHVLGALLSHLILPETLDEVHALPHCADEETEVQRA